MQNKWRIIEWDEGKGARYLWASRCERLERVGILKSPWEREEEEEEEDKNQMMRIKQNDYGPFMSERDIQHI